ncbi:hypothetical protein BDV95DRAFT_82160 [Massariosphaeria phaeospora]|uniref:Uncharacterized protein n=1 Tax=Massariosphaeria phaeospora TaxID=100035 RepID=A0A7C8ML03_9PLEO|nr:hypothetical protein BDV95DRAFT_82160 [Massariosphaeria phaeospora]
MNPFCQRTKRTWSERNTVSERGTNMILFMPFLHYETYGGVLAVRDAIRRKKNGTMHNGTTPPNGDELLLDAYLGDPQLLHLRRTLDQYLYPDIDTTHRDLDQVLSRESHLFDREPKVVMVDQLWLFILGKELIITAFPGALATAFQRPPPHCRPHQARSQQPDARPGAIRLRAGPPHNGPLHQRLRPAPPRRL